MKERISVSGIGMIGPFGTGKETYWQGVVEGRSFLGPVTRYDVKGLAGEVKDFSISNHFKDRRATRLPLITQYALVATMEAIRDARLDMNRCKSDSIAMAYGTGNGSSEAVAKICRNLLATGQKSVDPLLFQESVFNAPASFISIHFGMKGPCVTLPMGMTAGHYALAVALNLLKDPAVSLVLVVSSDQVDKSVHEGLGHLRVLSSNGREEEGSRPFDKTRNGLVFSEGAVALVVERASDARERGARIYGEIAGNAVSHDAYRVADNNPDGRGMSEAMKRALADAGVGADAIGCVIAAAHSSRRNDIMETRGIKTALGSRARSIPVTSIKSSIGETFGPGGLFNVATAFLALRDGVVPPTINYRYPDPECDLDIVANRARVTSLDTVMCNSFNWCGMYGSTIVRRNEGG
ncbi:MAG: 3-oxoacyl-(acyl-carrier-protein) synthase 2 [Syntrophorhabdus sp. PtaB.Bin184]|nr:MAG: 3-oxoacyl-(acyl-carrier-protein) synthase 2 [Syntrophorhabdus sp. PtaB.Bin184]